MKRTKVNQSLLKEINRKKILRVIHERGESSRAEIRHLIKQDGKTVTNIVNGLVKDGLLTTSGYSSFTGGRRRELLIMDPRYGYIIGIHLDINFLVGIVTNFQSKVILRERIPVCPTESKSNLITKIRKTINFLISKGNIPQDEILGIGFVASGFYDQELGKWLVSVNNLYWKDVPIVSILSQQCQCPIYLEDCSRALALGEKWFGSAKNEENFICLDIGAGIGCAIFQENRLYTGSSNFAGELGHTIVIPDGEVCSCGNRGCLETVASGWALVKHVKCRMSNGEKTLVRDLCKGNLDAIDADMIFQAAHNGDKIAADLLNVASKYLGIGIANLINLLNPELIVLSGHFSTIEDFSLLSLKETIRQYAIPESYEKVKIVNSLLGDDAAVLGATTLILDQIFHIETISV
ncbi:ROK family protein [bacterium]|nr:MAG: ROK family protein [bacterium]